MPVNNINNISFLFPLRDIFIPIPNLFPITPNLSIFTMPAKSTQPNKAKTHEDWMRKALTQLALNLQAKICHVAKAYNLDQKSSLLQYFPSNATQKLQPLNFAMFSPLDHFYRQEVDDFFSTFHSPPYPERRLLRHDTKHQREGIDPSQHYSSLSSNWYLAFTLVCCLERPGDSVL